MNKTDLVRAMSEASGLSNKDAGKALDAFIDTVKETLADEKAVKIIGFGNFELRHRAARKGRNPQTGEEIDIAASKTPAFKAGKAFKDLYK